MDTKGWFISRFSKQSAFWANFLEVHTVCGIAGWIDFSRNLKDEGDVIKAMTGTLSRRGPDAEGYYISDHVLFGHRRLAVVDIEGGIQPMALSMDGNNYVLIYNGELYNTEDIRSLLIARGHRFDGWSDTEVLLHAYAQWGEHCVQYLNGIFAFAVWDARKNHVFLARDRMGIKPLFYARRGTSLVFGSELKALFQHPAVRPVLGDEGLAEVFAIGPARTPGHGVISDIFELKPAFSAVFNRNGFFSAPYWELISDSHPDDFDTTTETVRYLVTDSIRRQLVSDVPLCVMLSGGLDSSAIAAVTAAIYKKEMGQTLRTYSVDYVDNDKNFRPNAFQPNTDAPWIARMVDFLKTEHQTHYIDTPELTEALYDAVLARDLPGMADIDSSLLLLSSWLKQHATVGLSGECADEVFGGYPWFYRTMQSETFPWAQHLDKRLAILSPELRERIRPEEYVRARYDEAMGEVPVFDGDSPEDAQKRALFYLNLTRWMPTLIDRKDRMSMYAGLELRVPYCDHRIVEYVWNIPWSMKFYKEREKGLLRHALTGILPEDVLWRKKSPFPKTHNPNYIDTLRGLTHAMLGDSNAPVLPFIDKNAVKTLADTLTPETNIPWFGQLMNGPQMLAYLLQINFWMKTYGVTVT
jgi:asparagine synthase (glutamine-hydrolysing)